MVRIGPINRERAKAVAMTAIVQGLIGYALIMGLFVDLRARADERLKVFALAVEPPPPPLVKIEPNPKEDTRPEGAASPPNLRAKATPVVMPDPVIKLPIPPTVVAALKPDIGAAPFSGNADVRGPGTGAGGIGDGTGSGGAGDGDGGGGAVVAPRWVKGRLSDRDYPQDFAEESVQGTVSVRYLVDVDGRAKECRVTRSSGNRKLDAITCSGIEERFRFRPSRDARGRPVPAFLVENHEWLIEDLPPDPPEIRRRRRFGF